VDALVLYCDKVITLACLRKGEGERGEHFFQERRKKKKVGGWKGNAAVQSGASMSLVGWVLGGRCVRAIFRRGGKKKGTKRKKEGKRFRLVSHHQGHLRFLGLPRLEAFADLAGSDLMGKGGKKRGDLGEAVSKPPRTSLKDRRRFGEGGKKIRKRRRRKKKRRAEGILVCIRWIFRCRPGEVEKKTSYRKKKKKKMKKKKKARSLFASSNRKEMAISRSRQDCHQSILVKRGDTRKRITKKKKGSVKGARLQLLSNFPEGKGGKNDRQCLAEAARRGKKKSARGEGRVSRESRTMMARGRKAREKKKKRKREEEGRLPAARR